MDLKKLWSIVGPQQNRTKAPYHRVRTTYNACSNMIEKDIYGDFVEVGTWKGGITAVMGHICDKENKNRKTYAFDSFQGMSKPDLNKDLLEGENDNTPLNKLTCLKKPVQLHNFNLKDFEHTCFNMVKVKRNTIKIIQGWVDNTLKENYQDIEKISVLRIDVDWYEPTLQVLEYLYPKVVTGGYIICDDYGVWKGARKAIDEYREKNNITTPLIQTPMDNGKPQPSLLVGTEHYWIKD